MYFDNNLVEIPLFKINWGQTDNLDEFIENITNFNPRGGTNIQKPLEYFKEYGLFNTDGNHYHILLTDGFPNDGLLLLLRIYKIVFQIVIICLLDLDQTTQD